MQSSPNNRLKQAKARPSDEGVKNPLHHRPGLFKGNPTAQLRQGRASNKSLSFSVISQRRGGHCQKPYALVRYDRRYSCCRLLLSSCTTILYSTNQTSCRQVMSKNPSSCHAMSGYLPTISTLQIDGHFSRPRRRN